MAEKTITEAPEFTQGADQVEELAASQEALVEYVPKSKAPFRLDTLIPRNLSFEVQKALNRVVKMHGNIDHYVLTHLKYPSTKKLWKGLAAEQVDSIGMYLHQFERNQGIIIADKTGIGKGRQAAAVIRHAIVNGYLPVFFTRKDDLFTDIYRDLVNIGHRDINPLILNTSSAAKVRDQEGHVVYSPMNSEQLEETLTTSRIIPTDSQEAIDYFKSINKPLPDPEVEPTVTIYEIRKGMPSDYDCIFTTYSQIQAAAPYKKMWLQQLILDGVEGSKRFPKVVFILDESHMAGGFDSIIGKWMREVMPHIKSCCFLSATFAKHAEVMPLYARKTAIHEAQTSDEHFVTDMQRGGLALQEIVAANLAESGQLIRRERSNEGILVAYHTIDQEPARTLNRQRVNRIISIMNEIVSFEEAYIRPILADIHSTATRSGEHMETRPRSLGVKQAPYFSRVFNIIDQLLFSLKVEAVAEKAIELLLENKKVVVAFKSTMGAFLKDLELTSGDLVLPEQIDFALTLRRGLDGIFFYSYTTIDNSKSREQIDLSELPDSGIERYHEIVQLINDERSGLTVSPIDELIARIERTPKPERLGGHEQSHFTVAEVTGRNQRLEFQEDGSGIVKGFRSNTERSFREFNNGAIDVLLINQSGSTGSSAHASEEFQDQRVRAMIIHQFEVDINTEIQKRGRTNRTGQVVLPEYHYMITDIPMEVRLMTMLKAKLKSLDANTTGSQNTSEDTLESADFLNKYGDKVAWRWVSANPLLRERLGHPTYHREVSGYQMVWVRNQSQEGAIRQVTGRAGLLPVEEQDKLYDDLLSRYQAEIKYQKQVGTYDLEIAFLKLDGEIKQRFLYTKGNGGLTPFGKDTVRDLTIIENPKRPFSKGELDELLAKALDGRTGKKVQQLAIKDVIDNHPKFVEDYKRNRSELIQRLQDELDLMPLPDSADSDEENAKIERQRERHTSLMKFQEKVTVEEVEKLDKELKTIMRYVKLWEVGAVLKIGTPGMLLQSWGVFLGLHFMPGGNPYTLENTTFSFAVADQRKLVEYNLTESQRAVLSQISMDSSEITDEERIMAITDWNELVKEASAKREKRHILTENILQGAHMINQANKLIKYNTIDGQIKNGILLSRDHGKDKEIDVAYEKIKEAHQPIIELEKDKVFWDTKQKVRFVRNNDKVFELFIVKKGNQKLFTDQTLRSYLMRPKDSDPDTLPEFVQKGNGMLGIFHQDKLQQILDQLDTFDLWYATRARPLEDWEIENEEDWKKRTKVDEVFTYKLARPYGDGSNPTASFMAYIEPTTEHPFGSVQFDRPLTDKERYNFSLIPLFSSIEEPLQAWKSFMRESAAQEDLNRLLTDVRSMNLYDAIEELGQFMVNNPHEDGNMEFVFGEYTEEELGRAAFEDLLERVTPIKELIAKLNIELQAA